MSLPVVFPPKNLVHSRACLATHFLMIPGMCPTSTRCIHNRSTASLPQLDGISSTLASRDLERASALGCGEQVPCPSFGTLREILLPKHRKCVTWLLNWYKMNGEVVELGRRNRAWDSGEYSRCPSFLQIANILCHRMFKEW